jgi:hypothetical protein
VKSGDGNESNQRRLFPLTSGGYLLTLTPVTTPVPEVEDLIERLAVAVIGETVNQYADSCSGGVERRERLSRYLSGRWSTAAIVLVGEAAGYRGCRLSGIAFTSMRQLGLGPESEASATIVHRTLAALDAEDQVILWNIVPTHPCRGDAPLASNRTPTRAEVAAGAELLSSVVTGRSVIAVGKVAQRVLGDVPAVRHPAYGGAAAFGHGLTALLSREAAG